MNVNMYVEKFVDVVYPGFICGTSATCVFCCICSVLNNVVDDCWRSHGQVYLVPTKAVIIVYKSYQDFVFSKLKLPNSPKVCLRRNRSLIMAITV